MDEVLDNLWGGLNNDVDWFIVKSVEPGHFLRSWKDGRDEFVSLPQNSCLMTWEDVYSFMESRDARYYTVYRVELCPAPVETVKFFQLMAKKRCLSLELENVDAELKEYDSRF